MTTKKQKLVEAIASLDAEKEQMRPYAYGCIRGVFLESKLMHILKWMSIVPVVRTAEDGGRESFNTVLFIYLEINTFFVVCFRIGMVTSWRSLRP